MALTPEQEQEMIQIELELRSREEAQTPDTTKQQELVKSLESQQGDASVISAQKKKLELMQNNQELPFSLRPPTNASFDKEGEKIATDLAQGPMRNSPGIAAATGTAFAMIPRVIEAALTLPGSKAAVTGAKAGAKALGETSVGKAIRYTGEKEAAKLAAEKAALELKESKMVGGAITAAERVKGMAKKATEEVTEAAQQEISQIQERIKELPILKRQVLESAKEQVLQGKAAIGNLEKEMGIDLATLGTEAADKLVKNSQQFVTKFGQIANRMSPKQLAESVNPKALQVIRKAAERAGRAARQGGQDFAEFSRIESHFRKAIEEGNVFYKEAIGNFKRAAEAVKTLPGDYKAKAEALASGLQKMQTMAKEKVMTDAKVIRLNRAAQIVERRAKELPRQFANEKATIDLAIQNAKNLAQRQVHTRWLSGGGAAVAAVALGGRKAVNLVTGGQ